MSHDAGKVSGDIRVLSGRGSQLPQGEQAERGRLPLEHREKILLTALPRRRGGQPVLGLVLIDPVALLDRDVLDAANAA